MSLTAKDLEALRLLADTPDGLAEGPVTSAEFGTIYHATARRLLAADENDGFGEWIYQAGRDRYLRPVFKIGDNGRDVLRSIDEASPTTKETTTP